MLYRDAVAQIREFRDRNLTPLEIAQRLAMSLNDVLFVQKMLTEKSS
jgi:hypothetical protein